MLGMELILMCAPNVDPGLMQQVIQVESSGNPWAINVNGDSPLPWPPRDREEAVEAATYLLEQGYSFDSGLGQINSQNFGWLGLDPDSVFDPCINLTAAEAVLVDCYQRAIAHYNAGQPALYAALSCYNTGSFTRGWANGYLARYGINEAGARRHVAAAQAAETPQAADTAVYIRQLKEFGMANDLPGSRLMASIETIPVVSESPEDMDIPGVHVEYDTFEAESWGAFEETALTDAEAWHSNADMGSSVSAPAVSETAIVMGGRPVPRAR